MLKLGWTSRYVGLPFVDHGRDFKGVDCWGLVQLVMRRECQVELPPYAEISALDLAGIAGILAREAAREPWIPVAGRARRFDVAVMHRKRAAVHVGIMVDAELVLHTEQRTGAVMVPVKSPLVSFRAIQYFRHRELLNAA